MTLEVKFNVEVTNQDIDDIMCTALEGGITYWCRRAEVVGGKYLGEYAHEQISRGGEVAYIEEGVLGYGTTLLYDLREPVHLKFVVIKEVYLNEWSSAHSIRQYNRIPQKYNKMLDEYWEKKEQEDIA